MLQPWQIERCRAVVGSDYATNYELRMVAEVFLYYTLSEHSFSNSVDLLKSIAALQNWKREWQFLIGIHFPSLAP